MMSKTIRRAAAIRGTDEVGIGGIWEDTAVGDDPRLLLGVCGMIGTLIVVAAVEMAMMAAVGEEDTEEMADDEVAVIFTRIDRGVRRRLMRCL